MTQFSFKLNEIKYTAKITNNGFTHTYNRMVHVYKSGEGMPLTGFACKYTDTIAEIKPKAIASIERYAETSTTL